MNAAKQESANAGGNLALRVFVVYLAIAYPLILFYLGKDEWFVKDDWNLLLPEVTPNLFAPVEQHWSTIPILIYRAYFHFFGANYFPFLVTVSALHLTSAALLRAIMRRAGASPWASTLGAALLVLFGPGFMSIVFAIQITQNLSIVLGLTQMILADHDGPPDRRDWAGLALGALSLMCSGLAPILVIGIGVATLARRGIGAALFHTLPLGMMYVAWWYGHRDLQNADLYRRPYADSHPLTVAWRGLSGSMQALGHFGVVGIAMAAVLAVGLYYSLASRKWVLRGSGLAMPLGLLVCAPTYFVVLGLQRSRLNESYILFSHHMYTAACVSLPALVCAADAIARRARWAAPILASLGFALVPLNAWGFGAEDLRDPPNRKAVARLAKQIVLTVAHSPYASSASNVTVDRPVVSAYAPGLRLGWLLEQGRLGRIPRPGPRDPEADAYAELFYGISDLGYPADGSCEDSLDRLELRPKPGDTIGFSGPVVIQNLNAGAKGMEFPFTWPDGSGHVFRIELADMHLLFRPTKNLTSISLCRGPIVAEPYTKLLNQRMAEAIRSDAQKMTALRGAIANDPAAMEALRREMAKDPAVMEALRKAMTPGPQPPSQR